MSATCFKKLEDALDYDGLDLQYAFTPCYTDCDSQHELSARHLSPSTPEAAQRSSSLHETFASPFIGSGLAAVLTLQSDIARRVNVVHRESEDRSLYRGLTKVAKKNRTCCLSTKNRYIPLLLRLASQKTYIDISSMPWKL